MIMLKIVAAALCLLRGNHPQAIDLFISGLKTFRQIKNYRNALLPGFLGYLYVIACLRAEDTKVRKQAHTYLNVALKNIYHPDYLLWTQLEALASIQAGDANVKKTASNLQLLTRLFQCLLYYWTPLDELKKAEVIALYQAAEKVHCRFVMLQTATLLSDQGVKTYTDQAQLLSEATGMQSWLPWFARQQPWENQLAALINLPVSKNSSVATRSSAGQKRLVWLLSAYGSNGIEGVTPAEQKCNRQGEWSSPKIIALKKLPEKFSELNATEQDRELMSATYLDSSGYQNRAQVELNIQKALVLLIGHPHVFMENNFSQAIALVSGAPELIIKEQKNTFQLSFDLPINANSIEKWLVVKESEVQWKIIEITDSIKQIARILGKHLEVPKLAKDQLLQVIQSLAGVITIQSAMTGAANVEPVNADERLHVHLWPYDLGLKCQIRVQPLGEGSAYYEPGVGAPSVIATVANKTVQTQRNLKRETDTLKQLLQACPILALAEKIHDQYALSEAEACLTLLLQLQEWQALEQKLVIAWPEGEKLKVSRLIDAKKMHLTIKHEQNWFEARGEIRVDANHVMQLKELLVLVNNSSGRFIALGDNAFMALTESFHRRLQEFAHYAEANKGDKAARIHALAANALESLSQDAGQLTVDQAWKDQLTRLSQLENYTAELPSTLQADLRDYQLEGYQWLSRLAHWGVGACLADDMGLGKTIQALALLLARGAKGPALVIAPTSVCTNWVSEAARFAPTLKVLLFGAGNREKSLKQLTALDLVIVSYGLFQQEAELFAQTHWHTLILDEAQSIKNAQTKRAQAVLTLNSDFRVIMTGTPLENHLGELWSLFRFINPGLLGSLEQFNQRYALPIERDKNTAARNRLRKLVHPFMLRRTKNKVLTELPPRIEILLAVDLSAEETALYEALRQTALDNIENSDVEANKKPLQILAEIMKLRRACCHPDLVAPELALSGSKLAVFGELVEDLLSNNHKALVFSQFVGYLEILRKYLDAKGVRYQYLDGATPVSARKKRVEAFQAGEADLFLISLKAGGTGLNLTAADYVIHMDPWWNPAVEDQASDRAHRMGQARTVTIYRLVAKHTIEESIVQLHAHKRDLADSLLVGSELATKMSAADMLALLKDNR